MALLVIKCDTLELFRGPGVERLSGRQWLIAAALMISDEVVKIIGRFLKNGSFKIKMQGRLIIPTTEPVKYSAV